MIRRLYDRLEARMGTRGVVLALLGLMWIGRGLVVVRDPEVFIPAEAVLFQWLPIWLRVSLWVGSGVLALVASFIPRPKLHLWAWGALIVMPMKRAVSYFWSMMAWVLPNRPSVLATAATLFVFVAAGAVTVQLLVRQWRAHPYRWGLIAGGIVAVGYLPAGFSLGVVLPGSPGGTAWAVSYLLWWGANVAVLLVMAGWAEDSPAFLGRTREEVANGGRRQ